MIVLLHAEFGLGEVIMGAVCEVLTGNCAQGSQTPVLANPGFQP